MPKSLDDNGNRRTIRTMQDDKGEPLFCGKDVAVALGYKKPLEAIAQHVEEDDSAKHGLIDSLGRAQRAIFINESGLYALISGRRTCFTGYCFSLDMATALGQRPKGLWSFMFKKTSHYGFY